MRLYRYLVMTTICLAAGIVMSGEFRRSDVSADAKWVVHLDFDGIRKSQFGKHLLGMPVNDDVKRKLNSIKVLFGLDLLADVKGCTAYGATADEKMGDGVILLRTRFDKEKVLAALQLDDGYREEAYGDHTMLRLPEKPEGRGPTVEGRPWGCFYAADTVVIARTREFLKKSLDVLDKRRDSVAGSNPFPGLDELEKNAMFMAVANLDQIPGADPKAKMLQRARSLACCIREKQGKDGAPATFDLSLIIAGKTPEASQRIRRSIDGLVAMIQMGMDGNPALEKVSAALDHLRVIQEKCRVRIDFKYPVDRLVEFLGTMKVLGDVHNQENREN